RRSRAADPHQRRPVLAEGRAGERRRSLPPPRPHRRRGRAPARGTRRPRHHRRRDQRLRGLRAVRRRPARADRLDPRQRGARAGRGDPRRCAADRADPAGRARRIAERAHRRDRLPLRDPPTPAGEGMSGSPSLPTPESTPVPTASRRSALRPLTALAVPALLLLAVLAALLGMAATGALRPATLVPASPLVTFGLPVVRVLHHLGLLLTI